MPDSLLNPGMCYMSHALTLLRPVCTCIHHRHVGGVCIRVPVWCVHHAGLSKKSLASVHLSGAMGQRRWPSSGSRTGWWDGRMWDDRVWIGRLELRQGVETVNAHAKIYWLVISAACQHEIKNTLSCPQPSPFHRKRRVSKRSKESKRRSPAWALNVTVTHRSLSLNDADTEPFWLPHQSSQGVKNIYMQIRMTHWLLWAR